VVEARSDPGAEPATVTEAIVQLRRTAAFLRSMPIARLTRGNPTAADLGRAIANSAASLAAELLPDDGPPVDARLPQVEDRAVGDLIAMVAAELEYVTSRRVQFRDSAPPMTEVIRDCIHLRRTT
jgi:hypothetical protein